MRIIAGRHRGRKLLTPEDRRIRPTSDRAREALFAVLHHGRPALGGARFLDLFCGTGAVGLEAWSRGAAEVLLVDQAPQAVRLAEANVARLGAPPEVRVRAADASSLGRAPGAFDMVFLDPPYRSGLAAPALTGLARHGWLAEGARVVVQLAPGETLGRLPSSRSAPAAASDLPEGNMGVWSGKEAGRRGGSIEGGEPIEVPHPFALDDQRRYGNARFLLLRYGAGS